MRRSIVTLQKPMYSINQGRMTSRQSGVNAIQRFTIDWCVYCIILNRLKVINYHYEISSDDTQHDILSETILFGDLYCRLGYGLDPHK